MKKVVCTAGLVTAIAACLPMTALASSYPAKAVELVVPNQPGGGTDIVGRAVAEAMHNHFPKPIVVVNKPGASGSIGMSEVARGRPDGYKLSMIIPEIGYLKSMGIGTVSHEDFIYLARFTEDPASVTVRHDAPWNTLQEFLDHARANPEAIRVSNAGPGTVWHLSAVALEHGAQVKFGHIPYQGSAPATMALLGGQVEATTVAPGEMTEFVKAGRLKVLGVMSEERIKGFENVPTLKESGVNIIFTVQRGIGAPKDTPAPIVAQLREAFRKAGEDPALRQRIESVHINYSYRDGEAFQKILERDAKAWQPLIDRIKAAQ